MEDLELKISLIPQGDAVPTLPQYQSESASARDIAAFLPEGELTVLPGQRALVPTGLRMAVPEGYGGFVLARSGLAFREGIALANGVGLIDPDYRGEVKVAVVNLSDKPFTFHNGDRVAQLALLPTPRFALTLCDALEDTARGEGGFGSTGRVSPAD